MIFYALRKQVNGKWLYLGKDYKMTSNPNRAKPFGKTEAYQRCETCFKGYEPYLVETRAVVI